MPFSFVFDPAGHLVVTEAGSSDLSVYSLNADDTVTALGSVTDGQAALRRITEVGSSFYGSNAGSATISAFQVGAGGTPVLTGVAASTEAGTTDSAATPNGRFLYVTDGGGGNGGRIPRQQRRNALRDRHGGWPADTDGGHRRQLSITPTSVRPGAGRVRYEPDAPCRRGALSGSGLSEAIKVRALMEFHSGSTIVVVGASLAGLRAAEGLRAEGYDGRIVLVGAEAHEPYDRPPLSKQLLAGTWGFDRVRLRDPEKIAALGLDLRLGHTATAPRRGGPPHRARPPGTG